MFLAETISFAHERLQPQKLRAARELRGFTMKALADRIDKTSSAVSQYESGKISPDINTFAKILRVLDLPATFFSRTDEYTLDGEMCHFRANKDTPISLRKKAKEYGSCILNIYSLLEDMDVAFPEVSISSMTPPKEFSSASTEQISMDVRREWGLGLGPIANMAQLMESKGIFVVLLPGEYAGIDAFSSWAGDRPCIFVVSSQKPSRMQFEYGHELAHLLFHRDKPTEEREIENFANSFSGAFLAPAQTFSRSCPSYWNMSAFCDVKRKWFISIQAAMYRAREVSRITDKSYRNGIFELNRNKFRKDEPCEFGPPMPSILAEALELVSGEIMLSDMSKTLGINEIELEIMLTTQGVSSEIISRMRSAPRKANVYRFKK